MDSIYGTFDTSSLKLVRADKFLNTSVTFWFLVAVIGQWIFAYYVAIFYGGSGIQGNFEKWLEVLPHGYVAGETIGNLAIAVHLAMAVILMIGGPLQLVPQIRNNARTFHRWNGKLYLATALIASLSGLYIVWTRGTVGGTMAYISISINAVLIMIFAVLAFRTALAGKFDIHRRWVLRLFLVVNGVWFFRVGLMLWLFIHQGPVGFDMETFQGPFLTFLGFSQYLVPLAILELYLRAQDGIKVASKYLVSVLLLVLSLGMGVGIFAATMSMWLPYL